MRPFAMFAIIITLMSCDRTNDYKPLNYGYNYYPIETGNYVIYHVDSLVYNDFTRETDTFRYELKEEIGETFTDLEGRTNYVLRRSFRPVGSNSWQLGDLWSLHRNDFVLERQEENVRLAMLVFPLKLNLSWDGNAFNSDESEAYQVTGIDQSLAFNGNSFDSTLTVLEYESENLIERRSSEKVYAREVGLVKISKEYIFTRTDGINPENDVDSGFTYVATIIDYHVQ